MTACADRAAGYIAKIHDVALKSISRSIDKDANLHQEIKNRLARFKSAVIKEFNDTDNAIFNEDLFNKMDLATNAEIIDITSQISAVKSLQDFTRSLVGIYDTGIKHTGGKSLTGLLDSVFSYIERNTSLHVDRIFGGDIDKAVANINVGGAKKNPTFTAKAQLMITDAFNGGTKLQDYLDGKGLNFEENVISAMKAGHHEDEVLNALATVYKNVINKTDRILAEDYPTFRGVEGLLLNIDVAKMGDTEGMVSFLMNRLDLPAFLNRSQDDFIKAGQSSLDSAEEKITSLIEQIKAPHTTGTVIPDDPFSSKQFIFKDIKSETEFYTQFGDTRGNLLFQVFKRDLTRRKHAARHALLGPNPLLTIDAVKRPLMETLGVKGDEVEKALATYKSSYVYREFPDNIDDEREGIMYTVFNRFISAGLVGKSALRNVLHDNTIHAAVVKNFMEPGSGMNTWMRHTSNMLNISKGNREKAKGFAAMLEDIGLAVSGGYHSMYAGMMMRGDGFWTGRTPVKSKTNPTLHKLSTAVEGIANIGSRFSGSNWTLLAARSMAATDSANLIQRALKNNWKDIPVNIKREFLSAGINETYFNVFKNLKMFKKDGRNLGFVDFSQNAITREMVAPLMDKTTSFNTARRRVKDRYINLMSELMGSISPIPTYRARLGKHDRFKSPLSRLLRNLIYKFGNITQAAHLGMFRTARHASGLDPNTLSASLYTPLASNFAMLQSGHIGAYSKILLPLLGGGMLMSWASDLVEGKELRKISPKNLALSLGGTELGGYFTSMLTNAFWNESLVPDPSAPLVRGVKDLTVNMGRTFLNDNMTEEELWDKRVELFRRNSHILVPPAGVWAVKAATNLAIRKSLMHEPFNSFQRKKMEEDSLMNQMFGEDND